MVEACPICQCHFPKEPRQPLQPSPVPECPWKHIGADFFTFDRFGYLVIIDYYTKMAFIRKIPPSQCNAAKTLSMLKDLFSKHGTPETIRSDNGPQFASHQFAEFAKEWNFDHNTSSPRNPRNNGKAEAAVKVVKGLLTHAKYSGQDPTLPCWHTGVHPLMPTFVHQLRCSTREYSELLCLKGSGIRTPKL